MSYLLCVPPTFLGVPITCPPHTPRGTHTTSWVLAQLIYTLHFEATRGLFWNGPRNFELCSDDEGDTHLCKRSRRISGRTSGSNGLAVQKTRLHGSSWMELSGPEAETLPLGHRGVPQIRYLYYR
ncbi:hypothetical protein AVEN_266781-1 [Araneus ventricosus]|uniref:Uncharacterized protein n=1 Tax=Araneus ventricosus TaxID=182803 RepID=A0A4Y2VXD2_ARAVE|nr:hypothetical protein AVEN_266781-1 [Araneus ventricosus]